jgi:hypothetical protein
MHKGVFMKKAFKIEITEIRKKVVEVEASSLTNAIVKVGSNYNVGMIGLDEQNIVEYKLEEHKSGGVKCI